VSDDDFLLDTPMLERRALPGEERLEKRNQTHVPSPEEMCPLVADRMTIGRLAASVPSFATPVRVRTHHKVFVADKAA